MGSESHVLFVFAEADKVDSILCRTLDTLEAKVPLVKETPDEVRKLFLEYVLGLEDMGQRSGFLLLHQLTFVWGWGLTTPTLHVGVKSTITFFSFM